MVVDNVQQEGVALPVWSYRYAVELWERNTATYFVLIFEIYKLLHKCFDDVVVFKDVKDGLVGEHQYSFLALTVPVELHYLRRENYSLVLVQ